ncbi:restriction endonuclease subunit S [uncultured Polaribacter sp.]|uniref:restriction endonuclease subunit S n=1 Tax=uncultured Polaribacter sp. TaxID=174711 RepID=UPI00261995C8|nr:restriction endonuclease subunit S [uncultured Polaribacter sp.]
MKKYEVYKESGIEWMKEIPDNWLNIRLRYLCDITTGDKDTINQVVDGEFPFYVRSKDIKKINSFSYDGEAILTAGDGDICKIWHYVNEKFDFHQRVYMLYNFKSVNGKFLYYFLKENFIHEVLKLSAKSTVDSLRLPMFLNFPLCIPENSKEQTQIANYLDHKTTIIDGLIDKKEQLIKKLQAQRKAIINEAVTKGLNKNAKMKNSGIEWLGEIPEHWSFISISKVAKSNRYSITGGPFGSDLKQEEYTEKGVRIIQLQNIGVGEFKNKYKIFTTEKKADELFSCNVFPGDLIIAKMADPVARACIVPNFDERFIMASDGIRFEVDETKCYVKFLEYAINSKYLNFQAELKSTGTTRLRIGLTEFKKFKLLLPNLKEQAKILFFIENKGGIIIKSVSLLKNQIKKLKAYRQAIISEAVTGKIDVRDWQAPKK